MIIMERKQVTVTTIMMKMKMGVVKMDGGAVRR